MSNSSSWLSVPQRLGLPETPFKEALWQLMCRLRVAAPGIVQNFDSVKQTVTVRLAILEKMKVNTPDGQGGVAPVAQDTPIPDLENVPIVIPRAGGFELTFPINAGDECLVVFGDNCYNSWWASGGVQGQEERRRHSLSDAIAIFGLWSQPHTISAYSQTAAQLRSDDGTMIVEVGTGGLTLKAGSTVLQVTPTQVTVTGNLVVSGTLHSGTATLSDAVIDGRPFLAHEHTGVTAGGGITGGVV